MALLAHVATPGTASSGVTTSAIDTTGATLIVVSVSWTSTQPALSDSKGNTWTGLGTSSGGGGNNPSDRLFYCLNPIVGTGHTFTLGASASSFSSIEVAAFSGYDTYDGIEGGAGGVAASTTLATGSVTPTVANALLVAGYALGDNGALPLSVNSGFTLIDSLDDNGVYGGGIAYLVQGAAAAVNLTWTRSNSSARSAARIAAFRPSAAGPQSATPAAAISTWLAVAVSVALGAVNVSPAPATRAWNVVTPTVTVGAVSASPAAATSAWSAVAPTVTAAITVTPSVATRTWSASTAVASVGGVTITPTAAISTWSAATPTTTGGALPSALRGRGTVSPRLTSSVRTLARLAGLITIAPGES